jgi:hypothetical protein
MQQTDKMYMNNNNINPNATKLLKIEEEGDDNYEALLTK